MRLKQAVVVQGLVYGLENVHSRVALTLNIIIITMEADLGPYGLSWNHSSFIYEMCDPGQVASKTCSNFILIVISKPDPLSRTQGR